MSDASPAGSTSDPAGGSAPLLELDGVSVAFGATTAVRSVSYSVAPGEVVAVVGESGSGKTVTAMSLLGLLPSTATVGGRALLDGRDLYAMDAADLRAVRGGRVGMVFQEPMSALNPVFTIGAQIVEAIRVHQDVPERAARERAVDLLRLVGLPSPERRFGAYPHELSGGQLQRVVIAMAVANDPALLIADEPTTALDVTIQAEILELLRDLRAKLDTAILLITHDMGVVADLADRVVVMYDGRVVEQGPVSDIFGAPRETYTKTLLGSVISLGSIATAGVERALTSDVVERDDHVAAADHPARTSVPDTAGSDPILSIKDLSVTYGGRFRSIAVHAADSVNLHIERGEVLGLVGESGSGKSTVAGAVSGLVTATSGTVLVAGQNLSTLRGAKAKALRRRIGVVFQDPLSSLNPRATIAESVAEPLELHRVLRTRHAVTDRVADLLTSVQLDPALAGRYPHELSGGQRQRACIARALALEPDLLIADEPTSALDVSVQARVLELFQRLQEQYGFACLFISHDLAVIEKLADRVAVMHRGHVVEQGRTHSVLAEPLHPYTRRLLAAAPVADPEEQARRRAAWRALPEE